MYMYLGLGSNQGDRAANLRAAIASIKRYGIVTRYSLAVSPVYESAPMYVTGQPKFLNMVLSGSSRKHAAPDDLLIELKAIEQEMGRELGPAAQRFGPRPIDVDILLLFQSDRTRAHRPDKAIILDTPNLTIPHPRMAERAFVLFPLRDLAPNLKHPTLYRSISDLAGQVESQDCRKLGHLEEIERSRSDS